MRHFKYIILLFLIFYLSLSAQTSWERIFGGSHRDQAFSVQQTQDGGYIIAGFTGSFGHGCYDAYVVKTDASGDTIWTKCYGTHNNDYCWFIEQTQDSGYILAGATDSIFQTGPHDVYLVKTDGSGDTLWSRVYGDTASTGSTNDVGHEVHQTQDGGYIIVGSTESYGAGIYDIYLIKTDSSGDTIWTKTYGTASYETGETVQQTQDGGYIIGGLGYTATNGNDAYLIRTNSSGDTAWTKYYGGSGSEDIQCVLQTQDGGYIFVGSTSSYGAGSDDIYLVKTDATGVASWTRTYGGSMDDWGKTVQETPDGGYIIVGAKRTSPDPEFCYIWILKTDSNGDTLWTRIRDVRTANGMDIRPTQDGGYIIAAITWDYGGDDDFYLVKTDSTGQVHNAEGVDRRLETTIKIFPNPFTDFAKVPGYEKDIFVAFDINGRMVGNYKGNRIGADLKAGVYFIFQDKMQTGPARVVKLQ